MKFRFILFTAILLLSVSSLSGAEKTRIAVLDLKATGVPESTSRAVSGMLRSKLIDSGLFVVVERTQMDTILKEQGLQQTGCTDAACAVQIGKMLSAKKILIGEINRLGDTYVITCRVVDVQKGTADYATDAVAENEKKIYSTVNDLVYKLGKRMTGRVKSREFGKAPEGFYLGYRQHFIVESSFVNEASKDLYPLFYGGTAGYLLSFSQYLSFSGEFFISGASGPWEDSYGIIISGISGGARTGIYLHDRLYLYLGLSLQLQLISERNIYSTNYFGGIGFLPMMGFNIMFTPDIGIFIDAGYGVNITLDREFSANLSGISLSTGIIYNFFSI